MEPIRPVEPRRDHMPVDRIELLDPVERERRRREREERRRRREREPGGGDDAPPGLDLRA